MDGVAVVSREMAVELHAPPLQGLGQPWPHLSGQLRRHHLVHRAADDVAGGPAQVQLVHRVHVAETQVAVDARDVGRHVGQYRVQLALALAQRLFRALQQFVGLAQADDEGRAIDEGVGGNLVQMAEHVHEIRRRRVIGERQFADAHHETGAGKVAGALVGRDPVLPEQPAGHRQIADAQHVLEAGLERRNADAGHESHRKEVEKPGTSDEQRTGGKQAECQPAAT